MSAKYHDMCSRNIGKACEIRTRDGRFYRGIIDRVESDRVYLRKMGSSSRSSESGSGYGYDGFGYPGGFHRRGSAFIEGLAIGLIASLIFIPFFW